MQYLCSLVAESCEGVISKVSGDTPGSFPPEIMGNLTSHYPVVTSTKDWIHITQMKKKAGIFKFDYGEVRNLEKYGQRTPPRYPIEEITHRIWLFGGSQDQIADQTDVAALAKTL